MAIFNMVPPSNGNLNTISYDSRLYSSTPGVPIPVPDFDSIILAANGWTIVPPTPPFNTTAVTATAGLNSVYYFEATVAPQAPSSATVPVVTGEAIYEPGAAAIVGGHMIGTLGRVVNNNPTTTVPLAIGSEGKIDNGAGGTITVAVCNGNNLASNTGTITALYFNYADLASNTGTIGTAAGLVLQVDQNTGAIGSLIGVFVPTLAAPGTITTLYGMFFGNNPSAGIGTKHCILCQDPGADINTVGPIVTTGKTTTATFQLDTGTKTATALAGAATLNKASGKITSEALTTAAGASYTLTLTNSAIAAADTVFVSVANGTNSAGLPVAGLVTPGAGSVTIIVNNMHTSAALNGTLMISFASMKA